MASSSQPTMNYTVLSKLAWTDNAPVLKLRLLHTWNAGNPWRGDGFVEFATLWTDELGKLVQGLAARQLASHLTACLIVGEVYFVTHFTQRESRKRWAACSNERTLHFTSSTSFVLSVQNEDSFCADSFEFRSFEDLPAMAFQPTALVDVVGRLVSVTPVTYFQKQERSVKKQTVVIENERNCHLSITPWADFADKLPLAELIQVDAAAPVIGAFTSLNLSLWRGNVSASNTTATRIVISPAAQETQPLTAFFGDAVAAIGIVPAECDTPEKALTLYRDSFKTIPDLQAIQADSNMGGKFRCKGKVTDIDTSREWCYLGCAVCFRTAIRRDAPFWCEKCQATVHPHQLKQCFRIRLMVHDGCAFAPFVLLGQTAENFLEVSAGTLLAAAPDRGGGCPPEIEALVGQECIFLVNLPLGQSTDPMDDFCALAVEKESKLGTLGGKGHGPRFGKKATSVIATVPHGSNSSTNQFSLAYSPGPLNLSPAKRPRPAELQYIEDKCAPGQNTPLPDASQLLQPVDTGIPPATGTTLTNLLAPSNIPATPAKELQPTPSSALLTDDHSSPSPGLNSPLAAITIETRCSSAKGKGVAGQPYNPSVDPALPRVHTENDFAVGDTQEVHEKIVPSGKLRKDIPPAMLPIRTNTQPLAKVKLEKLESSLRKKKQQPVDSDDVPIAELKKKTSKTKSAAKKLFD